MIKPAYGKELVYKTFCITLYQVRTLSPNGAGRPGRLKAIRAGRITAARRYGRISCRAATKPPEGLRPAGSASRATPPARRAAAPGPAARLPPPRVAQRRA